MTLYHGASDKFSVDSNRCLYMTPSIDCAKEFALGLDDCGNYNPESYIYALDIDESLAVEIEDFDLFDAMGYTDYENMPEISFNKTFGWYCIKHPKGLRLVEHFANEL